MSSVIHRREICPDLVRKLFNYDPLTGDLTRKIALGRPRTGKSTTARGYKVVMIDGKLYFAHVIAWIHYHGKCPPSGFVIDHENQDKLNLKIKNLRIVPQRLNCLNAKQRVGSQTGFRGVYPTGRKFMAKLRINGKLQHLGSYSTVEEASAVYEAAKAREIEALKAAYAI